MKNSINVTIGDLFTEITRGGEKITLPTTETVVSLFRFILEDDCALFVEDNRIDRDENLSFAM